MRILTNNNNELRSGFKLLLFFFIYTIFTSLSMNILVRSISAKFFRGISEIQSYSEAENYLINTQAGFIISKLVETIILFMIIAILLKALDNKSIKDIGFNSIKENSKGLFYGLILGALSMAVIFFALIFSKNITLTNSILKPNLTDNVLLGIPLFILVAISEEIMCRGYILNTLNQMKKPWISAILSSAIFAALHLPNPNIKVVGILNIFMVGVLFSYMYIRTKSLWMPIGYHFTWNYFQGNIFGFPVSGTNESLGIYNIGTIKENILTGGRFGPEAGILATIVIIISFAVIEGLNKE